MRRLFEPLTDICSESSSPKDGAFPRFSDSVVLFVLRQHLGQAKVTDFHPHLALHQNVSSGQVSVDVTLCGKVVHTLEEMKLIYGSLPRTLGIYDYLLLAHRIHLTQDRSEWGQ